MSSVTIKCADEIINICQVWKALPSDSAFDLYKQKLLGKLQRLSLEIGAADFREDATIDLSKFAGGQWVTSDNGNRIFIDKDGNPIAGNPHVLEAITRTADERSARQAAVKKYPRKNDMECEETVNFKNNGTLSKDSMGRDVTHFNHDEDSMQVAMPVYISTSKKSYKICKEPIEHLTVFASSKIGRGLDVAKRLSKQCGGSPDSWKHCKGIGVVEDEDGVRRKADLHWFESPEVGQVLWKVKRYLDDMPETERYWLEEKENGK